jgi:hypothetical protein
MTSLSRKNLRDTKLSCPCDDGVSLRAWPNSPPNFLGSQPFAMQTLRTCSRTIEQIAKPMSTLQDTS